MDELKIKYWNGFYYCTVKFPGGSTQELKSADDITFTKWKEKVEAAWADKLEPEPELNDCVCPKCKATFVCPNNPTVKAIK